MRASLVVYALLLSRDAGVRGEQLEGIAEELSSAAAQLVVGLEEWTASLATAARLPLVELSIPAIREVAPVQYEDFRRVVRRLIEADREIDLFEYALEKCLDRHLAPAFVPHRQGEVRYHSINPLLKEIVGVLAFLTRIGHSGGEAEARAYRDAMAALGVDAAETPPADTSGLGLGQVDEAIGRLAQAAPGVKKLFLRAAAQAVSSDGVLELHEGEMLRALADALDCPIPPFVELDRGV